MNKPSANNRSDADFYIRAAYLAFLNREPKQDAVEQWRRLMLRTGDPLQLVAGIVASNEYQRKAIGGLSAGVLASEGRPIGLIGRAWRPIRRLLGGRLAMQQRVALLSAWMAQLSQNQLPGAPSALQYSLDRLATDQMALAHRLSSIEHDHASSLAAGEVVGSPMPAIDGEPRAQPAGAATAGRQRTQGFEDAGLNLTTGPYGRFLTIVPDLIGSAIERGEFWDPHIKPIIERCADLRRSAIDVGAYIGFHTVFLARHFGRVHSFEPQPRCFRLLNANVELNGLDRVYTYNRPLYDAEVALELAGGDKQQVPLEVHDGLIDYAGIGNAAALAFVPTPSPSATAMRAATIDGLGLQDVAFIKVDAQGCDLRVLKGAQRTIGMCRPTIVFEFEEELASYHGDTLEDFREFFAQQGYDLTELAHGGRQQWDFLASPRGVERRQQEN